MNKDMLETQWPQIREILNEKFSNLTEEDIRQINGRYDQLVAKLQQKYGYTREEAEDRIRSWNFDKFATTAGKESSRDTTQLRKDEKGRAYEGREKDDSSLFKWILGLGIPLILVGGYFLTSTPEAVRTPVQEQSAAETSADRYISDGLRTALLSQSNVRTEMQNVQITTQDGIVTLSGTAPTREIRDHVVNTSKNYNGVKQVIDNIKIE